MKLSETERLRLILRMRHKNDPCRQMALTPAQSAANTCTARYIAVRGSNRSGKTAFSAYKLACCARRLPNVKTTQVNGVYMVFAPSRSQLSDPWGKKLIKASEVMGDLFNHPFIPDYEIANVGYTYGAGEPTISNIELKNGNRIIFCVSGDKNVWKRVEGKGCILGVILDESAGSEQLLEELVARLLDANSNPQVRREAGGAWLLWGATQTKKSPAFEHFLSLCQNEAEQYNDYAAFTLPPGENPAIDEAERNKLSTIMSEDAFKIRMQGHGSAASAMAVFPQWDDERNYTKVSEPYIPGDDDNLWVGYDPGTHYTGIIVFAINRTYPLRMNVVKVWQPQRSTLEYDIVLVRDYLQGRKLEGWIYDQAARKVDKSSSKSVLGEINTIITRKGYDIQMYRGFMMGVSRYEKNIPLMRSYLKVSDHMNGYPTNFIVNSDVASGGPLLRWQFMNFAFTDNAYELKESNIKSGNDHVIDAALYACSRQPCYVDRGKNPKLWGAGTAGVDPDGDRTHFDKTTVADQHITPAQAAARSGAARRHARLANRPQSW